MNNTQVRILSAAVSLFAKLGYNAATTRAIAVAADVNEATIFRLFGSKRELFQAAITDKLRSLRLPAEVMEGVRTATTPNFSIRLLLQGLADVLQHDTELIRLLQFTSLEFGTEFAPLIEQNLGELLSSVTECLNRLAPSDLRRADAQMMILSMLTTAAASQTLTPMLTMPSGSFASDQLANIIASEIHNVTFNPSSARLTAAGSE